MRFLGVSLDDPFDPKSWSGSSRFLFEALRRGGVLEDAIQVRLPLVAERWEQARAISWSRERWKAAYNASESRFRRLGVRARREIARHPGADAVLQIGARLICSGPDAKPIYGYHDSNAAERYRYFDHDTIDDATKRLHVQWEQRVYSSMRGIFVMSEWLASSFVNDFGVPREKLHVVGAGINFERLPEIPVRRSDFFSAPRFLFVGKEFERKGGAYLLEAFRRVREVLPDARLTVVGPDAATMPPQPGVIFAGFLSKSDPEQARVLRGLFEECTAVVLPSVYEPFGISLIEGMAYGVPGVAVDRCAMPEIVLDGETGCIARAEDADSLADALLRIGENPNFAADMGRAARKRVESTYTWDAVSARMAAVLHESCR